MKAPVVRYAVRCEDFTTQPVKTREAAERRLERIQADGRACHLEHQVVEV